MFLCKTRLIFSRINGPIVVSVNVLPNYTSLALIVRSLFHNFNCCAICFWLYMYMNIACKSTQNDACIKPF